MGVTAIKQIKNTSASDASIRNIETPSDTSGGKGDVAAGSEKPIEIWIPWCWAADQFAHSHINIDVGGQAFAVWQANLGGSDRVRFSTDQMWHNPGDPIAGFAQVDGERILVIDDQGISLEEYIPSAPPPHQYSNPAHVSFFRPPVDRNDPHADPFSYTGGTFQVAPQGATIDRIRNTAVCNPTGNKDNPVPLTIGFQDSSGRPAGPIDIDPNQTVTGDFVGLLTDGMWQARARNISAVFLTDNFDIELYWLENVSSGSGPLMGTPNVTISTILANPPGADVQPETGEYVELMNLDSKTVDVAGWYITDEHGTKITIPAGYLIKANGTLRIYTGPGTNSPYRYYAGRNRAVWNNRGDTARLFNSMGGIVYTYVY